ncbi:TRAP transporter substrate-binding protein DctP [Azospirillum sp. RWY-5-1]|uniref:TRAP transporter substrate-binding protein DctP n=1 Tax=Azospirillum oleiclasticum TaxID=2735135 RepID=A0ABX2TKL4_9PROT|nr:TRAP transporter substrate-binding protein DctP [Azospirillum oleiclasticum]NYZ16220.1 TRAP transporter substrate-binding protein DctP [Azospirillum oleiclasticum]NYZ23707.1 TRAP transporter substrate-binding protein DctP [Azospirillum oleiclasticum]
MFKSFTRCAVALGLAAGVALSGAAPAQAQGAAQAPIEMVLTNEIATSHWGTKLMEEYAGLINQRTQGRIKARVFPSGTLYKDKDAVAALGSGSVHMVWPVSVQLESIAPAYGVVNLPFAVTDEAMQRGDTSEKLAAMLSALVQDKGIRIMGLMRTADLMFLFKDKEIDAVNDLKGAKVRLTGGRVLQSLMRDLGANPISMPASEMAAALMQGAIDGIYTSAGGWEMVGTNAARTASIVPGMNLLTYSVCVDDKWLKGLPADLRKVVEDTTAEVIASQWKRAITSDQETMDRLIATGGKLVVVPQDQRAKFLEIGAKVSEEYTRRFPEVWKQFQSIVQTKG